MTATARSVGGPSAAPVWCGSEVAWLDPAAERLRVGRVREGAVTPVAGYALDARPLSALPARDGWLVATRAGVVHLGRDGRQRPTPWPPAVLLSCDPAGRLWLATATALLRADLSSGVLRVAAAGPTLALAWHPDTTTLFRSTPTGVWAHPYDLPNGALGVPRRVGAEPSAALAVDRDGDLWTATASGLRSAAGSLLVPGPTGCCLTADTLVVATPTGLHSGPAATGGAPTPRFAPAPRPAG